MARAELSWRDRHKSDFHSAARPTFRREQFASSWAMAPLSLQTAAIQSEAADILRGSPEVLPLPPFVRQRAPTGRLRQLLAVASELEARSGGDALINSCMEVFGRSGIVTPSGDGPSFHGGDDVHGQEELHRCEDGTLPFGRKGWSPGFSRSEKEKPPEGGTPTAGASNHAAFAAQSQQAARTGRIGTPCRVRLMNWPARIRPRDPNAASTWLPPLPSTK